MLRILIVTILLLEFFANNFGLLGVFNSLLKTKIPTWLAFTDVVVIFFYPFGVFQFPAQSNERYIYDFLFTPFFIILVPCFQKLPNYVIYIELFSFLYYLIRRSYFDEPLPRMEIQGSSNYVHEQRSPIWRKHNPTLWWYVLLLSNISFLLLSFISYFFGWWNMVHIPIWMVVMSSILMGTDFGVLFILHWKSPLLATSLGIMGGFCLGLLMSSLAFRNWIEFLVFGGIVFGGIVYFIVVWIRQ